MGLAALLQSSARAEHTAFALVRAFRRESTDDAQQELEGFVSPDAWQRMAQSGGDAPRMRLDLLITGRFEAPDDGAGHAELLAFEPEHDPSAITRVRAHVDCLYSADDVGARLAAMLGALSESIGVRCELDGLHELEWAALEPVLRAEATLNQHADAELAAFVHLTRALDEAPSSCFLLARLARLAARLADKGAELAMVQRVLQDAREASEIFSADLACALALVTHARGDTEAAERALREVIAQAPSELRAHALLARIQRERGDLTGARDTLLQIHAPSPEIDNELVLIYAALAMHEPVAQIGFTLFDHGMLAPRGWQALCELAKQDGHETLAGRIVDRLLLDPGPSIEALIVAVGLLARAEPPGIARDQRLAHILARVAHERPAPELRIELVRALGRIGERGRAEQELQPLARGGGALAAAVAEEQLRLEDPESVEAMRATLRAALEVEVDQLERIAERARYFASAHDLWSAHLARVVAERRLGKMQNARDALSAALARWPECPPLLEERERFGDVSSEPEGRMRRWWRQWRGK